MKKLGLDLDHPFFAPVWRRWVIVLFLGGWTVFELVAGGALWGALFGTFTVVCIISFFGGGVDYSKYDGDGGGD